mmetsp:Transcript_121836/g.345329  ORF Transcript_121836/g.345329 Transcript_121836/m.345329 type:complete len:94 (+) Transcript_121836:188-469(+)
MVTIMKPVAWEVLDREGGRRNSLTTFLKEEAFLSGLSLPFLEAGLQDFTFCTCIDAPCSGIVLAATTMRGYWEMRLQMQVYQVDRCYVVVVSP